jgi:hypothetical protein
MEVKTPKSLAMEHEDLLKELESGFQGGGKVADAARKLMEMIRPHFATEEQLVLPPLSLLPALAAGNITEEMKEVLYLTDQLKKELPLRVTDHQDIGAALKILRDAAKEENRPEMLRFAKRLMIHAQNEEEVLYPASMMVGEWVKLTQG